MGVYCPTMQRDIHSYVQNCSCEMGQQAELYSVTTLYLVSSITPKWVEPIVKFLTTHTFPENMSKTRQRYVQKQAANFCLISNQLYHRGKDEQLQICVIENEYLAILEHAHSSIPGGHFLASVMAKTIMREGLWWPTLMQDAEVFVKKCDECQRYKAVIQKDTMPLRPMMGARAFAKWGIDFIGPIDPPAMRTQAQYIIATTDYVTKWVEAKAT